MPYSNRKKQNAAMAPISRKHKAAARQALREVAELLDLPIVKGKRQSVETAVFRAYQDGKLIELLESWVEKLKAQSELKTFGPLRQIMEDQNRTGPEWTPVDMVDLKKRHDLD